MITLVAPVFNRTVSIAAVSQRSWVRFPFKPEFFQVSSFQPLRLKTFHCDDLHIMCGSRNYPYYPHGRSLEIPRGRGDLKAKLLEGQYKTKLEFPGGCGGAKHKTFRGGSMDIFWNCTILSLSTVQIYEFHILIFRTVSICYGTSSMFFTFTT